MLPPGAFLLPPPLDLGSHLSAGRTFSSLQTLELLLARMQSLKAVSCIVRSEFVVSSYGVPVTCVPLLGGSLYFP